MTSSSIPYVGMVLCIPWVNMHRGITMVAFRQGPCLNGHSLPLDGVYVV